MTTFIHSPTLPSPHRHPLRPSLITHTHNNHLSVPSPTRYPITRTPFHSPISPQKRTRPSSPKIVIPPSSAPHETTTFPPRIRSRPRNHNLHPGNTPANTPVDPDAAAVELSRNKEELLWDLWWWWLDFQRVGLGWGKWYTDSHSSSPVKSPKSAYAGTALSPGMLLERLQEASQESDEGESRERKKVKFLELAAEVVGVKKEKEAGTQTEKKYVDAGTQTDGDVVELRDVGAMVWEDSEKLGSRVQVAEVEPEMRQEADMEMCVEVDGSGWAV